MLVMQIKKFMKIFHFLWGKMQQKQALVELVLVHRNHLALIDIELVGSDDREFSGLEFERLWRNNTGQISGARSLEFQSSLIRSGDDLNIELSS